ncbi:DDB_G0281039-like MARVEL transmembrane domain-containing 4 [Octopus vulgaris]|nr:DDB_G0281039-like MARVEL transmembrane domain-containing 4 [Octopus vulgaris]
MKTSSSCKPHIYTSSCSSDCPHLSAVPNDHIILTWNFQYCRSFQGILRLLQVIFSVVSLVCLTTSGRHEGGYLSLPLCWHFRIMVFILVLTLLSSFVVWTFHAIGLSSAFPINWYFLDMIAYSIFAFLYLVGASLVASAFDFYEKMQVGVTHQTIQQLILSVIIGYICLFLYGTTAVIGYRQWRIQLKQYQHRKLLEEDNYEV